MSDTFDDRWARMRMWSVIVHRDDDLAAHGEVWAKAKPSVEKMFAALTDDFALLTTIQVPVPDGLYWVWFTNMSGPSPAALARRSLGVYPEIAQLVGRVLEDPERAQEITDEFNRERFGEAAA